MAQREAAKLDEDVQLVNASGSSSVVLICEHASHFIPAVFDHLGLRDDQRQSHVAWDPGAMGVARNVSTSASKLRTRSACIGTMSSYRCWKSE